MTWAVQRILALLPLPVCPANTHTPLHSTQPLSPRGVGPVPGRQASNPQTIVEAILSNRRIESRIVSARALAAASVLTTSLSVTALITLGAAAYASPVSSVLSDFRPHRAVYAMSLESARNSAKVVDIRGRMMFEWADSCDGWTTEQRFQLRFSYSEGDEMNMTTNYAAWEARDGRDYHFSVRKLVNGEVDEEISGRATLKRDGSGGTATFRKPEETVIELPPQTMFPTAHTFAVLEHARNNERFFVRQVFDGSEAEGATEVSTVIAKIDGKTADLPEAVANDPLIKGQQSWPVRMAYFPTDPEAAEPEYEMSLRMMRSGIAQTMHIDYGDFVIKAVLERIEALAKPPC